MPRVMVKDGVLVPLDPLPMDWGEGDEFYVRREPDDAQTIDDAYWEELERLAAQIPTDDLSEMQAALDEHRREAKDWMRRRMELP